MIKLYILTLTFILGLSHSVFSQCSTLVQMTDIGVEGCSLPVVVETQELLLPCLAPAEYNNFENGEYAYIDYKPSGCASFCQLGMEVDITCFTQVTSIEDHVKISDVKTYPTITESQVVIECKDLQRVEIYDMQGKQVMVESGLVSEIIDVSNLTTGIYYVRVITSTSFQLKTIIRI